MAISSDFAKAAGSLSSRRLPIFAHGARQTNQTRLNLVVHAHMPLRDRMRSTTSTGTESRGHQSTPDHGGVPPCCLPVIRRNVPADAARSHIHMQDSSRDGKQRSNLPISDRLRRWISARNGRSRSDHDRVVMGRLSLAVRLPQF